MIGTFVLYYNVPISDEGSGWSRGMNNDKERCVLLSVYMIMIISNCSVSVQDFYLYCRRDNKHALNVVIIARK
jgi:hypothetical protein